MLAYFKEQETAYKHQKLDQTTNVLFESKHLSPQGIFYRGFSEDYQRVICYSEELLLNYIRTVKLVSLQENGDLIGVLFAENPD